MKISHMLIREDFYNILDQTLKIHFKNDKYVASFYVYPQLNAIMCATPSRKVKKYIYKEYRVNTSFLKRVAIKLYCFLLMNSFGLLSRKKIKLCIKDAKNALIYPCNKKIRIFNFKNNVVEVVPKWSFSEFDLKKEIDFRNQHCAEFIPKLLSFDNCSYTEEIIDGYPLARASSEKEEKTHQAYDLWRTYTLQYDTKTCLNQYVLELNKQYKVEIDKLKRFKKLAYRELAQYWENLTKFLLSTNEEITLTLSHGDLQAGNIWIKNVDNKIVIIDWESFAMRSVFYDEALLFCNIRKSINLMEYVQEIDIVKAIVLAEDFLYRLQELCELPEQFGSEDFVKYFEIITGRRTKDNV